MPSSRGSSWPRDQTHDSHHIQAWPAGSPKLRLLLSVPPGTVVFSDFFKISSQGQSRSTSTSNYIWPYSFSIPKHTYVLLAHDRPAHHTLAPSLAQCCCSVCLLSPSASGRSQGASVRHSMNTTPQRLPTPLPPLLPQMEAFCFLFVHIYYLIY